jgi:hypothetical protein
VIWIGEDTVCFPHDIRISFDQVWNGCEKAVV